MHDDLRRRALESGKTVSRKARSRQSSQPTSRVNSPAGSRLPSQAGSRVNSDDEGDSLESDEMGGINANISEASDEGDALVQNFETVVENLLDRSPKRQNGAAREANLKAYGQCLRVRYEGVGADRHESELVRAFLRSVKADEREREVLLALSALSLTFLTAMPPDNIFEEVSEALKKAIADSMSTAVKAAAIHALGMTSFYSGFSEDEMAETRAFLLEIISSDGGFIDALDISEPVLAAIQEYGFLVTLVADETREEGDFSTESQDASEALVDQLSSSDTEIQVAAGECIALLYEVAYTPLDSGETANCPDSDAKLVIKRAEPYARFGIQQYIRRYQSYRQTDHLESQLESISTSNTHSTSRKKKKELRSNLADVLNSIRNPAHGPHYQTAIDWQTEKAYGSRLKIKLGVFAGRRSGFITIDRWTKLLRYEGLKRVLEGYFTQHAQTNDLVSDLFQITWDDAD